MVRDSSIHPERHAVSDIIRSIIDTIEIPSHAGCNQREIDRIQLVQDMSCSSIDSRSIRMDLYRMDGWMDGWLAVVPS